MGGLHRPDGRLVAAAHALDRGVRGRGARRLVLEPGVGGEIYEETGGVRRHWARIDGWEPPNRLSYTWHVNPENPPTNVAVTFEPVDGGTRVEIVHSGWEAYADAGVTRASYGSAGGWELVAASFASALD